MNLPIFRTLATRNDGIVFAVFSALITSGIWLGSHDAPTVSGTDAGVSPTLSVDPATLDFGTVDVNSAFDLQIWIKNSGNEDITIEQFVTTCYCTSVEPQALVIPAGAARDVKLTLDLVAKDPELFAKPVRDFEVSFAAVLPDGIHSESWKVHGAVRSACSIDTPRLRFLSKVVQGQPVQSERVSVHVHDAAFELIAECDTALADVSVRAVPGNGSDYVVDVRPNPSLPPGPFEFLIVLSARDPDGGRHAGPPLVVSGVVDSDPSAEPSVLRLGLNQLGAEVTTTVAIVSPSQTPFDVAGITPGLSVGEILPLTAENPSRREFQIKFLCTELGRQSSEVRFDVVGRDGVTRQLVVPLTAYVVDKVDASGGSSRDSTGTSISPIKKRDSESSQQP